MSSKADKKIRKEIRKGINNEQDRIVKGAEQEVLLMAKKQKQISLFVKWLLIFNITLVALNGIMIILYFII